MLVFLVDFNKECQVWEMTAFYIFIVIYGCICLHMVKISDIGGVCITWFHANSGDKNTHLIFPYGSKLSCFT